VQTVAIRLEGLPPPPWGHVSQSCIVEQSEVSLVCVWCVQVENLVGLGYILQGNPRSQSFAPKKLYLIWDLAGRAIDTHGAVGEDVELRPQRAEQAALRAAIAHRMGAEQAETRLNPRDVRFTPMQLYRAADVARACLRHGFVVNLPPARNEAVTERRELEQRRMFATVLSEAMGMDRERAWRQAML